MYYVLHTSVCVCVCVYRLYRSERLKLWINLILQHTRIYRKFFVFILSIPISYSFSMFFSDDESEKSPAATFMLIIKINWFTLANAIYYALCTSNTSVIKITHIDFKCSPKSFLYIWYRRIVHCISFATKIISNDTFQMVTNNQWSAHWRSINSSLVRNLISWLAPIVKCWNAFQLLSI